MTGSAKVTSVQAVDEFRGALSLFREEVTEALIGIDMEAQRVLNWLKHDQMRFWGTQVRRRQERLSEAKAELHRKQLTSFDRENKSFVEEKQALRRAQRQVEEAEEKLKKTRRWAMEVERAIGEYKARIQALQGVLDMDLPKAAGQLTEIVKSLEAYLDLAPPETAKNTPQHAREEGNSPSADGSSQDAMSPSDQASNSTQPSQEDTQ